MAQSDPSDVGLSRRSFLGWGVGVAAIGVVPGATFFLGEGSANAAVSPYAWATWLALTQQSVQVAAPGRGSVALKVSKVTNLARPTTKNMTGDVFSVMFATPSLLPSRIYTVTSPRLGTVALFLDGVSATTARLLINQRVPAA